jgi:hypothetical protein
MTLFLIISEFLFFYQFNSMVKFELLHCIPNALCSVIYWRQLVKGVSLAGLLPVRNVAFVTCRNTLEQFKVIKLINFFTVSLQIYDK